MAPIQNRFRQDNLKTKRNILNIINKTKQIPVKRLKPVFHKPNYTKVIETNVPVETDEPVAEQVSERVEPVAKEVSKPIEPRRPTRVRKPKLLEIEQQPKPKAPRNRRIVVPVKTEPVQDTEPVEIEQPTKSRELLKRNYVKTAPAPPSEAL